MSEAIRERDRMITEMLASYCINVLDPNDLKRVTILYDGLNCQHYYIDYKYAFTVTRFTRMEDDWGVNGRYEFGESYKIEFLDKLKEVE